MRKLLRRILHRERAGTSAEPGFSDLLGYQAIVGDGVVLLKDRFGTDDGGPLLAGFWYRGPDIESASADSFALLSQAVNAALKKLDAGWMVHVEAVRIAAHSYERGEFVEAVDALIDEERDRHAYHYSTEYALFVTHVPGALERAAGKRFRRIMLGDSPEAELEGLEGRIARFESKLAELDDALSSALTVARMRADDLNDELLQALNLVVNGKWQVCRSPRKPVDLACLLARDLVWSPSEARYGDDFVELVGLMDLPPSSVPGLLHSLTQIDAELRWSSRFILMDYGGSRSQLKSLEAKWTHKLVPLSSHMLGTQGHVDRDALERVDEVQEALADLESGVIRYGHYTSVVVVRAPTREEARRKAAMVVAALEERGFLAVVEKHNRMEAFLGSLPGHGVQNVRKPMIHTLNLADLLPLGREWEGSRTCPSPMFPPGSRALLQARTWSGSEFHLNLHQDDVGHTLVLGPTGAGKSTLLATVVTQWMRYADSQVFVFDQGSSMAALTLARRDGAFFHLGGEGGPQLCPLSELDTEVDRAWAADWIESLCDAQGTQITPEQRTRIFDAVCELAESTRDLPDRAAKRTLTHLTPHLLDRALLSALSYYTSGPAASVLNGASNAISYARLTTFELEQLLELDGKTVKPTLMYLFREVEKRLDGRPTLLVLDEAWRQLDDPIFAARLRGWLKKLRKRNCVVMLATQQLSDVAGSAIGEVVFESCPTRILLPNELATGTMRQLYAECLGLSEAQVELLTQIERKRWYLYTAGTRSRVFTLDLGPVARACCGASSPAELGAIWSLLEQHGAAWPRAWLEARGLPEAAARFAELDQDRGRRRLAASRGDGSATRRERSCA
jgi:type IV secretion system protein VirB4